ncbi:hypothetical protein BT93_B2786 [Corymbia citriodora subsp. variegata]|nr:hypothetical protein BT93_B2786 [Corymbia citriodora subsp. variegata]
MLEFSLQRVMEMGATFIASPAALSMLGFTGLAILTGLVSYLYAPYWGVRKVPGPPAFPLVGHLPLMAKYGPDVFSTLAKRYGPIFRFHMGRQPMIIVADAELCKEVGIKKFKDIPNRSIPSPVAAYPLHQKGLFFTKDSRWSAMRNVILSVYQPLHLANLVPMMQNYIESATENLCSSKEEDVMFSNLSLKLATDLISQAAFGVDFGLSKGHSKQGHGSSADEKGNSDGDNEVSDFINKHIYSTTQLKMDLSGSFSIILGLLVPILQEPFRQLLKRIPGTMDRKVDQTNKELASRLDEIVSKRMKEKERSSKDFLSLLLNVRESEMATKNVFTPDYVSAVMFEHLLAGSSTTVFTLSSVIYLVAGHPGVEKKLLEEIDGFGPHDRLPTAQDLQDKFPYLDQVIKEATRLHLFWPLLARETSREVEIGGYLLPKGTWVWLALGVLAKDPKNFPEPEEFRPERFDLNWEEQKRRHPYALTPFGIGPRACIRREVRPPGNQTLSDPPIPEIHFSALRPYGETAGIPVRHSPQFQAWREA